MAQVTGTVTRPVECRDQNGSGVAYSFCNPATMPATGQVQMCSTNTYSWSGARSTCQATLSCKTLFSSLAGEGTCPQLTSATCASNPICMMQSYGVGNQTRDNICRDQNGNPVADALCPQPKPPVVQTCDGYARYTSDRSVCTN
jgi:hypothetical protein